MKARGLLLATLLFAGCGSSPPTRFFTLTPVGSSERNSTTSTSPMQVDAVHLPAMLDRKQMVRETGSETLSIDDRDQWGAPLGEMARNVLARDLAARMPHGSIIFPDAPAPASATHLVVNVTSFDEDADGTVRLEGSWSLLRGNTNAPVMTRDVALEDHATVGEPAAQAAAMSKLLGRVADDVARQVAAFPNSSTEAHPNIGCG
ncbi:MAG TPA: PqiC family protein [Candidatus Binataceae bacterium]|nr:PqiC family protein [Candidatus Binataceae bacterium]